MSSTLISLAASVGAPLVKKVLANKLGGANAELVSSVVTEIAERSGVIPAELDEFARTHPQTVEAAIADVETMAPEMIALHTSELEHRMALMKLEMEKPGWAWTWRPLWMFFLAFLWFWNVVALHLTNAILKWALPPMPTEVLLGLTALFMSLYMGGHTVKSVFAATRGKV
ncbi:hypothetical protein [Thalassococcus sp. S3]|uniref:hypothetical protein n=1 Tax=Thalassococcus sp. S3 TaxID=2017482 RepID=UPI001024818B|nr:hypothetical protein [Thalassococcus sp. S3]QBF31516.1 hypothetical protein CFI11_09845 [Thalassococcus sp. S3]